MKKFLMIACLALLSACATQTGNYSNASPHCKHPTIKTTQK